MKEFKFPKLEKEKLRKITGGTTYVDGIPWGGGFYNPNDSSDAGQEGGRQPSCKGNNPSTGGPKVFRDDYDCSRCYASGYTNCTVITY